MFKAYKIWWQRAIFAVIDRTSQQNGTLGRSFYILHTLSAASFIGAMTLIFSTNSDMNYAGLLACFLFVMGMVWFVEGMVLNRGE